ncbi:Histone-lysine N-methyltransferase SETMAR [Ooceraea biroi]|uniref:Histone-lysine N-methyltransferase SETMAR n=2 Tax=Ooceraea biroi TaxID=2015173 RepID=A0A026X2G8_OOCBI|nr:Histone-lysine N-methyltransferase SETMAR [Ooceraea biroi]
MEKSKIRVIYEYEFRRGTTVSETARNIDAVFGEGSTTKATVGNWFKNFRDGDFSLANEPRGRPKTKVDNDHLRAVVESDPSQSTRELASIFNVSIMVMQWTRGSSGIISLPDVRKICQIVAPNGVIVATSLNRCYHVVKVATIQHEGVWLARYNMYGMLEPIEQKFRVETFDIVKNIFRIFNLDVYSSLFAEICSQKRVYFMNELFKKIEKNGPKPKLKDPPSKKNGSNIIHMQKLKKRKSVTGSL